VMSFALSGGPKKGEDSGGDGGLKAADGIAAKTLPSGPSTPTTRLRRLRLGWTSPPTNPLRLILSPFPRSLCGDQLHRLCGPAMITYIQLISDYSQLMPGFVTVCATGWRWSFPSALRRTSRSSKLMESRYKDSLNSAEAQNECP